MFDPEIAEKFNFLKGEQSSSNPGMKGIPMMPDGKTPDVRIIDLNTIAREDKRSSIKAETTDFSRVPKRSKKYSSR